MFRVSIRPLRLPRWLIWLAAITAISVLLPLLGITAPQLEALRGFMYAWILLQIVWMFVGFYHLLKFVSAMLNRLKS